MLSATQRAATNKSTGADAASVAAAIDYDRMENILCTVDEPSLSQKVSDANMEIDASLHPAPSSRFLLMELNDPEIIKELEDMNGQGLVIRGIEEDSAVVCTSDATFDMRRVETSNQFYILSKQDDLESMSDVALWHILENSGDYIELKRIAPRLSRVKTCLMKRPYSGPEELNSLESDGLFTFDHLLDIVQCSEAELRQSLEECHALYLAPHYRLLDDTYVAEALRWLWPTCVMHNWSLNSIPIQSVIERDIEEGSHWSSDIWKIIFKRFGSASSIPDHVSMNGTEVATFVAKLLLKTATYETFMLSWHDQIPIELHEHVNVSLLGNLALIDTEAVLETQHTIRYLDIETLPATAVARFNTLFSLRRTWKRGDLEPWIADLAAEDPNANAAEQRKRMDALLLKYSRSSKQADGVILLTSRANI